MHLRIGVNLGDVISKDDTVYGDGVNVASRLEALAEPGEICVSRMVYDSVKNKLPLSYESLGKKAMKNIAEPVEVFRTSALAPKRGAVTKSRWRTAPAARRGVLALLALMAIGIVATWLVTCSP